LGQAGRQNIRLPPTRRAGPFFFLFFFFPPFLPFFLFFFGKGPNPKTQVVVTFSPFPFPPFLFFFFFVPFSLSFPRTSAQSLCEGGMPGETYDSGGFFYSSFFPPPFFFPPPPPFLPFFPFQGQTGDKDKEAGMARGYRQSLRAGDIGSFSPFPPFFPSLSPLFSSFIGTRREWKPTMPPIFLAVGPLVLLFFTLFLLFSSPLSFSPFPPQHRTNAGVFFFIFFFFFFFSFWGGGGFFFFFFFFS